jgi:hypothetical protein
MRWPGIDWENLVDIYEKFPTGPPANASAPKPKKPTKRTKPEAMEAAPEKSLLPTAEEERPRQKSGKPWKL